MGFMIKLKITEGTIAHTSEIWCDDCYTWVDEVVLNGAGWVCCAACGNGLIHRKEERATHT